MDLLILAPLDTLKQGQRSRGMGIKDLWENGEDKSKAWQNERMSFWKGNERSYLLFCPNWMFLLLGKWLLRVNQRKKRKVLYFPVVVFFLFFEISTVTGQDSKAYLHTSESSFAYQTIQNRTERVRRWCAEGRWRSSIFTCSQIEAWCGGPAELETTSRARSQQVLGKLLCHLMFLRWRTWKRDALFIYGGYQLFIKN